MFRKCTYWLAFGCLAALLPPVHATLVPLSPSQISGTYTNAALTLNTVPVASETNGLANAQGYSIGGSVTLDPNVYGSGVRQTNPWVFFIGYVPLNLNSGVYAISDYLNVTISDSNPSGSASLRTAYWTTGLFDPRGDAITVNLAPGPPSSCPLPSCTGFTSSKLGPSYALGAGTYGLQAYFWADLVNVSADEFVTLNVEVTTAIGDGTGPGIPYPPPPVPEPAYAGILALGVVLLFCFRKAAPQPRN